MFDSNSYHHTTRITQQPNDAADAARLYGELKKESLNEREIARTTKNGFEVVLHDVRYAESGLSKMIALYTLNGRQMRDEVEYDPYEDVNNPHSKIPGIKKIHEAMAANIAAEILEHALKDVSFRASGY